MSFKFVILIQSFKPFSVVMLSTIYMLFVPRHSIPTIQCNCYSVPKLTHTPLSFNLSTKSMRSCTILCNFPSPFCLLQTTFISTPFVLLCLTTFPTNIKLFFPRRFLLSTPLTTQTKTLPQPHKLSPIYFNYIITSTFAEIVIQFPTSTPLRLHSTPPSIIDFRPTILISTLNNCVLLMFNNVVMFKCLVLNLHLAVTNIQPSIPAHYYLDFINLKPQIILAQSKLICLPYFNIKRSSRLDKLDRHSNYTFKYHFKTQIVFKLGSLIPLSITNL